MISKKNWRKKSYKRDEKGDGDKTGLKGDETFHPYPSMALNVPSHPYPPRFITSIPISFGSLIKYTLDIMY